MAYWSLQGARMNCERCGAECPRNSYAQKYCLACRREVANAATRGWKIKRRAAERAARAEAAPTMAPCDGCGAQIAKDHSQRRFCIACREARDAEKNRESTRRRRMRPEVRADAARRLRERRARDPKFAIAARMSAGIYQALKAGKGGRRWESLVGYTLGDLVRHLERQFLRGMTWDNYGEWHIDHIRPVSSFRYETAEDQEFRDCWALTNLRPIWALDNMEKGGKRLHLV